MCRGGGGFDYRVDFASLGSGCWIRICTYMMNDKAYTSKRWSLMQKKRQIRRKGNRRWVMWCIVGLEWGSLAITNKSSISFLNVTVFSHHHRSGPCFGAVIKIYIPPTRVSSNRIQLSHNIIIILNVVGCLIPVKSYVTRDAK